MLYLTNSSFDKLHTIFRNNYCNTNCTVSLDMFRNALSQETVCATNNSRLELCNVTVESESAESSVTPISTIGNVTSGSQSTTIFFLTIEYLSADPIKLIVPLGIVLVVLSLLCYCCKDIGKFRFSYRVRRVNKPPR